MTDDWNEARWKKHFRIMEDGARRRRERMKRTCKYGVNKSTGECLKHSSAGKRKCYVAVHGKLGNEYTALGCNKKKAMEKALKLQKKSPKDNMKIIRI